MESIKVRFTKSPNKNYEILIAAGLLQKIAAYLNKKKIGERYVIITDKNVSRLYGKNLQKKLTEAGIKSFLIDFPGGEKNKTLQTAEKIINQMLKLKINRRDSIISLGGGVVSDLAGFVASTYMRGISLVQAPTTLLGMVDASIGGKNGVNLDAGKNLLGTIYQPKTVLIDPNVLKTLSPDEWENGFAEIIKYSIIVKSPLLRILETLTISQLKSKKSFLNTIIIQCTKIKASIIEKDELENDSRIMLNYGHTIGHAIETYLGYSVSHGKAVTLGIKLINFLAIKLDLLNKKDHSRIQKLINQYVNTTNLEHKIIYKKSLSKIWQILQNDKKVQKSKIHFVIPKSVGQMTIQSHITKENFINILASFNDEKHH